MGGSAYHVHPMPQTASLPSLSQSSLTGRISLSNVASSTLARSCHYAFTAGCDHSSFHSFSTASQLGLRPVFVLGPTTTVVLDREKNREGAPQRVSGSAAERTLTRHITWSNTSRMSAAEARLCGNAVTSAWARRWNAGEVPVRDIEGFGQYGGWFWCGLACARHRPSPNSLIVAYYTAIALGVATTRLYLARRGRMGAFVK